VGPVRPSAGYSTRSLAAKLGLRPGARAWVINAPPGYRDLLAPLPPGIQFVDAAAPGLDFIHLFSRERIDVERRFPGLMAALAPAGSLWISWPKRAARVPTDLDENIVREIGLRCGLVDVKVAAVDAVWSGLKFVYRLRDRPPPGES
jgi:hypothetical protein